LNHKISRGVLWSISCLILFACNKNNKSELVLSLEKIFYSHGFTEIPDRVYNVADFGAVADGKTLTTQAIQRAIDQASKEGGGKVVFEKGTYLSGAIFIKSNVEFHLAEGVVIKAIQDDSHYPERMTRIGGIEMEWPSALINVYEQKNVRITGTGTIDGNGKYWWDKFWGDPKFSGGMWVDYKKRNIRWAVDFDCKRVRAVVVYKSKNVLLKDFTIKRSGFWTVTMTYSNRVHVDGLIIRNNIDGYGPSSDGINTDSSRDILVENCDIDCNDDNLCIKAGMNADGLRVNRPSENIVYRNCITRSGHGVIVLGSDTAGGIRNVEAYGLEGIGTKIGIRFKGAKIRGGVMENIWFHDIKMKNVTNPFHFELNWYPEFSYPKIPDNIPEEEIPDRWRTMTQPVIPAEKGIPEYKNLKFSNIDVKNAKQAFYVNAYPEKPMRNLIWENITIEADEGGIVNHASNWKMKNVSLQLRSGNSIEMNNCLGVELPDISYSEEKITKQQSRLPAIEEQIKNIKERDETVSIIPVSSSNRVAVSEGDTILFSDSLSIHIFDMNNSSMKYYEPLGDGFYYSPVEISLNKERKTIEVAGQKSHIYTFMINSTTKPKNILGSDSWKYNIKTQQIIAEKKGISFRLQID
jgi:polygalacturonase